MRSSRSYGKMLAAATGVTVMVWSSSILQAVPMSVVADQDPDEISSFSVTFPPELGGETQEVEIPLTVYSLQVDADAGTARQMSYFQLVPPLDLLGFSTGDIIVLRTGESTGTYDAETGEFTTTDTYLVYFDDTNLADFGFVSPFEVPSTLTGTLVPDGETMQVGTVSLEWGGVGEVENLQDKDNPYLFTYTCSVKSLFDTTTTVLEAKNNPDLPNEFEVNFPPELGGETQIADIPLTEFVIEIDEADSTSRLLSWNQEIDPFDLLGFSTGPINVRLGGASAGTFDSLVGQFDTTEIYNVFFDDSELSAFGFTSPFAIPSSSTGIVTFADTDNGTIAMEWAGTGEVSNPQDPDNPYVFSYTCTVNSTFGQDEGCAGDTNGDGTVDPLDSGFVLSRFGCGVGSGDADCDAADQNGDGTVDPLDVGYVLARFGDCG